MSPLPPRDDSGGNLIESVNHLDRMKVTAVQNLIATNKCFVHDVGQIQRGLGDVSVGDQADSVAIHPIKPLTRAASSTGASLWTEWPLSSMTSIRAVGNTALGILSKRPRSRSRNDPL